MSHDRGCWKCGRDPYEYRHCASPSCGRAAFQDYLKRFDFGICRAAYDGLTTIALPEFWEDLRWRTFTLHRCENQEQFVRSMERYERLKMKYEGWTLRIPEEFGRFRPQLEQIELFG